jgi:hypothetical protein
VHIVNGKVVMALKNARTTGEKPEPMTEGTIQIQSEAAEVFFREIAIRQIDGMPKEYLSFFQ